MHPFLKKAVSLFKLKAKFALTSLVATAFDLAFYSLFVSVILPADGTPASYHEMIVVTFVGFSISVLLNFYLQKRFIFDLRRKVSTAFILAMCVSAVGLAWNTGMVAWLAQYDYFLQSGYHKILPKLIATGTFFFVNFYAKRYIFEKKLID